MMHRYCTHCLPDLYAQVGPFIAQIPPLGGYSGTIRARSAPIGPQRPAVVLRDTGVPDAGGATKAPEESARFMAEMSSTLDS
jgi:hypothetical protein